MNKSYATADLSATKKTIEQFSNAIWEADDLVEVRRLPSKRSSWHHGCDLVTIAMSLANDNEDGQNIYVSANPRCRRGRTNKDVVLARSVFADCDKTTVDDVRQRIKTTGLPDPTVIVSSGHGAHAYWRLTAAMEDMKAWSAIQTDLATLLSSDNLHDAARVMRLPGFNNLKEAAVSCALISCDPLRRYSLEELRERIPKRQNSKPVPSPAEIDGQPQTRISQGKRNSTLTSLAGTMVKRRMTRAAIHAALSTENAAQCDPPLPETEVNAIVDSVMRYGEGNGVGNSEYEIRFGGIAWRKLVEDDFVSIPLTNFAATIAADIARDDGSGEITRAFRILAEVGGQKHTFIVPADEFGLMMWPAEKLGAAAVIYPGYGIRDRARAAIQLLSAQPVPERRIYTHTGWRLHGNQWIYLHAGGAIGAAGAVGGVTVELPDSLTRFALPAPPAEDELIAAIRASLRLLELSAPEIMVPMFGAIWRAILGDTDFAIHLAGPTGVFKSECAALIQQHWGSELDARHFPAGWHSTDNMLEMLLFTAKDAIAVVDDFAPTGNQFETAKFHQRADRVIRAQGNRSGRGRMRSDGSLRPVKPPRGLLLSTGEEVPRGQSLRARMHVTELSPGDIDQACLSACQADACSGIYAATMSAFIQWLAGTYAEMHKGLRDEIVGLRAQAVIAGGHRRTPEIVANLAIGMQYFLLFAEHAGAISEAESNAIWQRSWEALGRAASRQTAHMADSEPTSRFIELLTSAINSGRAHLVAADSNQPPLARNWGWAVVSEATAEWQPRGECIGFLEGDSVYLDPDASYRVAQKVAGSTGDTLPLSPLTLRRRLAERNMIVPPDNRAELTVRRIFRGRQQRFLLLTSGILRTDPPNPPCAGIQ